MLLRLLPTGLESLRPGHRAQLATERLRESGAFAEVRELGPGLAFARLTDDPADALRPGYDERLERARVALRPILVDLTRR